MIGSAQWRAPLIAWTTTVLGERINLATVLSNLGTWLTNVGASIVREFVSNVVTVLLTFYLLFYFIRDHQEVLRQSKLISPLSESETDYLFGRVSDTIHAIIFGTVITAAVQGALGGLVFWLLGLQNPVFWGLVMALLAVIPILGAFVVWIPAAVYLALTGSWGKAALLTAYGSIVIAGIDNVLQPILAGGRLKLHTVQAFIAIVGGIVLFGASGLILGPLAVTTTIALLEIWRARADATRTRG